MRNSNDIAAIFITDLAGEGGHRVKATDASPTQKGRQAKPSQTLVVEPTHLKNMRKSNWMLFPPGIRVKIPKMFELPPPSTNCSSWPSMNISQLTSVWKHPFVSSFFSRCQVRLPRLVEKNIEFLVWPRDKFDLQVHPIIPLQHRLSNGESPSAEQGDGMKCELMWVLQMLELKKKKNAGCFPIQLD